MIQLALGPKLVQQALSLKSVARARQLWDDPTFPGVVDPIDGLLVDSDDLQLWWKARKEKLRAQKENIDYDRIGDAQEAHSSEYRQEEAEGNQAVGPGSQTTRIDYEKVLLRAYPSRSRAELPGVHKSAAQPGSNR